MEKSLRKFTKGKIIRFLEKVGSKLDDEVTIYMVGGGAMCLKNLKPLTRDLDVVIMTKKEYETFEKVFKEMSYDIDYTFDGEDLYREPFITFKKKGTRVDIFIKDIAGQLEFNKFMRDKSVLYKKFKKLTVKLASNEDIFLSKCMSDRLKDVEDVVALIGYGVDYNKIIKELKTQEKKELWRFWLYEQLCRIKNKKDIVTPLHDIVWRLVKKKWSHRPKNFMEDIQDERYKKELKKRKNK